MADQGIFQVDGKVDEIIKTNDGYNLIVDTNGEKSMHVVSEEEMQSHGYKVGMNVCSFYVPGRGVVGISP